MVLIAPSRTTQVAAASTPVPSNSTIGVPPRFAPPSRIYTLVIAPPTTSAFALMLGRIGNSAAFGSVNPSLKITLTSSV